jgi:FHS family L-fucose permease-like MFS transporter
LLQVVANPFIAELGSEASSHSRLTLAQAFNSLGTTIGPWVGAVLILRTGVNLPQHGLSPAAAAIARRAEAHSVELPFVGIAVALLALAGAFWFLRRTQAPGVSAQMATFRAVWALRDRPRLLLGAVAIFLYVGAEVSIGSIMTNYLMQPSVLALRAEQAGKLVSLYWGGAMVGRFIGSFLLRQVRPGLLLAGCAICTTALALMSSLTHGQIAATTIIAVGLFNSIMFPTIFALGCENLGEETPNGSALLVMAIVGGAVVPLITGAVADRSGISEALLVPAACYVGIVIYGALAARGFGLENGRRAAAI